MSQQHFWTENPYAHFFPATTLKEMFSQTNGGPMYPYCWKIKILRKGSKCLKTNPHVNGYGALANHMQQGHIDPADGVWILDRKNVTLRSNDLQVSTGAGVHQQFSAFWVHLKSDSQYTPEN